MITVKNLLSMGYRILDNENDKVYAKPVGLTLFVFDLNSDKISNWFSSATTSKTMCDDSRKIKSLLELQGFEQYTQLHGANNSKGFEFLSLEEQFEL